MKISEPLILAVLGEARAQGVSLSKTKLLKLLYLVDLETYRTTGETATGWHWRFLHFGPWAVEFDKCLEALGAAGRIETTVLPGDRETQLIRTVHSGFDVSSLDESTARMAARLVLGKWLTRDLPEILDFVYFETEPMRTVERGATLNFDAVERVVPASYKREPSPGGSAKIQALRRKLGLDDRGAVLEPSRERAMAVQFTAPNYDGLAIELLRTLEDD